MKPHNPWQDLDNWAMSQPRNAERRYAAIAKTMIYPFVQAQSVYGPLMLVVSMRQMIEALHETIAR